MKDATKRINEILYWLSNAAPTTAALKTDIHAFAQAYTFATHGLHGYDVQCAADGGENWTTIIGFQTSTVTGLSTRNRS